MDRPKQTNTLSSMRRDHQGNVFSPDIALNDPFEQFNQWLNDAIKHELEPNAFTLATATQTGIPSSRVVLLKGLDQGFIFYTNYLSHKGKELAENPLASANFFWVALSRQVRLSGKVEKVDRDLSVAYFNSRHEASRRNAIASEQSQTINENTLAEKLNALEAPGQPLTCPEHWGGYRLIPDRFEFWQGQPNRLHDRIQYELTPNTEPDWTKARLAP